MAELFTSFIDKIFNSSNDSGQFEDDIINLLFCKYKDLNENDRIMSLKSFVQKLPQLNKFNIKKWVLILSKLISSCSNSNSLYHEIIELFMPKPNENYNTTDMLGRKLGLLAIAHNLIPISHDVKIDFDQFAKLLYYISQFIGDKVVGIMSSLVISQYIAKLSSAEFDMNMKQIIKFFFTKHKNITNCPQLYPILLSLKDEHRKILSIENFILPDFESKASMIDFINNFKKMNNDSISIYFNCFAKSDMLKTFWELLMSCLANDKAGYREKDVVLNCIIETIAPSKSGDIDLANWEQRMYIVDTVWSNCSIWSLFLSHLSNEKSLFHSLCKTTIVQLRTDSNQVIARLFNHFLSVVDKRCHLMETNVPQSFRLSQCLIGSVSDADQLSKYIEFLMTFYESGDLSNEETVYIIEQIGYVCHSSLDTSIHNKVIDHIIAIQAREISNNKILPDIVRRSSFSAVIACIHHSVSNRNLSMDQYLFYLQSIIEMVISNLKLQSSKFKTHLNMFKSLAKYINEQLSFDSTNEVVATRVFPCFGSVICYLCLFLMSRIDLLNGEEKPLDKHQQIIDWIKQCFQAAHKSVQANTMEELPKRKRMLSISSLCSEDENDESHASQSGEHWSVYLIDILLKIYDEDATMMNEAVHSIVSLMIRTKTLEISGVRYIKNLILSYKARKNKILQFESVTQSSNHKDPVQDELKSRYLKERCLNILFTIIFEDDDVDMISSCLFILLDICSADDKIIDKQIKSRIIAFKEKSKTTKSLYLNGGNVIRAINSILSLSNDSSNIDNLEMASNMIIGLINRVDLNSEIISELSKMLEDSFYGSIGNFQSSILQMVYVEHVQLAWHMREAVLKCIEKSNALRLSKYKAFEIMKILVSIDEPNQSKFSIVDYDDFISKVIPSVLNVLSAFNFDVLNSKYATIVLECLIGLTKASSEIIKIPSDILSKFDNVLKTNKSNDFKKLINKFIDIYKTKNLTLKMISLEKLQEYDQHISYLLKLLPAEFNKDLDQHVTSNKGEKAEKEIKALSKFNMINQRKSIAVKSNKKNSESKKRNLGQLSDPIEIKKQKLDETSEIAGKVRSSTVKKSKKRVIIQEDMKCMANEATDIKPESPKLSKKQKKRISDIKPVDNTNKQVSKKSDQLQTTDINENLSTKSSKKHKQNKSDLKPEEIHSEKNNNAEILKETENKQSSGEKENISDVSSKKHKKKKKSKAEKPDSKSVENHINQTSKMIKNETRVEHMDVSENNHKESKNENSELVPKANLDKKKKKKKFKKNNLEKMEIDE